MSALRALTPFDGTPVAASLRLAADMVDGVDRDAVIVMFVDGEDGCEQNQCAVAREIAKKKPRLKVNIVDLTGANLSSCIAKSTGGKFASAQRQDVQAGQDAVAHPPGTFPRRTAPDVRLGTVRGQKPLFLRLAYHSCLGGQARHGRANAAAAVKGRPGSRPYLADRHTRLPALRRHRRLRPYVRHPAPAVPASGRSRRVHPGLD
ncbi:hypothetical protein G6F65_018634 [Rhizopus arrhizus]|nr:hypothetical protein G6F65_018634 [Rhizopus arrhizus]